MGDTELASTNGNQAVNSLDTSLHGLLDRLSGDDSRGLETNSVSLLAGNRSLAINGVTQSVDNTSKDLHTNWDVHNSSGSLDDVSFLDQLVITKDDNTNVVRLQVESHALQSGAELHHLFGLDVLETIDTSNTVSNGQDTSSFLEIDGGSSSKNSFLKDGGDLSSSSLGSINLLRCGELTSSCRQSGNLL